MHTSDIICIHIAPVRPPNLSGTQRDSRLSPSDAICSGHFASPLDCGTDKCENKLSVGLYSVSFLSCLCFHRISIAFVLKSKRNIFNFFLDVFR